MKRFERDVGKTQIWIYGPDFTCANLSDADFSGHPIFGFWSRNLEPFPPLVVKHPSFRNAILDRTVFERMALYGATSAALERPFEGLFGGTMPLATIKDSIQVSAKYALTSERFVHPDEKMEFQADPVVPDAFKHFYYDISQVLYGSTWQKAKWPAQMKEFFALYTPRGTPMPPTSSCAK
jgi:hypothetical protein